MSENFRYAQHRPNYHDGREYCYGVADAILEAATETIRQFDWFDTVQHGKPLSHIYAGSTDE